MFYNFPGYLAHVVYEYQMSINPGYGHLKNINAEIQKVTGFIPLTKMQVIKCFDFNVFVASRGTLPLGKKC